MEEERQEQIPPIGLHDLLSPRRLAAVYASPRDFYWSAEWTPEFFVTQARAGFISISYDAGEPLGQVLLPQIHTANAVLDWEDLHVSRSMRRWMRSAAFEAAGFELRVGCPLEDVIGGIASCHGEDNWMSGRYPGLLREVAAVRWDGFELTPVGLFERSGALVGGELGYFTGSVYTSMSGFLDRSHPAHNHAGKLQLVRLAEHLRDAGFAFWNLGQPHMQYKFDLGAKTVARADFLRRWRTATRTPVAS